MADEQLYIIPTITNAQTKVEDIMATNKMRKLSWAGQMSRITDGAQESQYGHNTVTKWLVLFRTIYHLKYTLIIPL